MVGEELCQGETLCTHFWLFFSAPGFCSDSSSLGKEGKAHIVGVKRIRELEKWGGRQDHQKQQVMGAVTRDEVGMEPLPGALCRGSVTASEVYLSCNCC